MSAHTPGPWRADKYCIWAGEKFIAGTKTGIGESEQGANARLIAAAPALLAALEALVERGTDSPVHLAAEAAIAQAKGGER